jgi:tRNA-dihydrouridine synthase B
VKDVLIGGVRTDSKLALAPMAGVCDLAFRAVCRVQGAGLTYTEMVRAKALGYNAQKTRALLRLGEDEHPAAAQIFGSDAACMAEGAALAREISGADIIDINMGCPVGKVVKSGDGSALMRDPDKAMDIIARVTKSVDCPVTVKTRKGWDKGRVNAVEFARMAEEAGAAAVAVHGRTRAQIYSGAADWDIIRDVKKNVKIPVLANGDVFSAEDAVRILRYTGADMVMIGRGAFGNPWIFSQAKAPQRGARTAGAAAVRTRRHGGGAVRAGKKNKRGAHCVPGGQKALRLVSERRAPRRVLQGQDIENRDNGRYIQDQRGNQKRAEVTS